MPRLIKLHTVHDEDIYINADHIVYVTPAGPEMRNTRVKLIGGDEVIVTETLDNTSDMISVKHKYIG